MRTRVKKALKGLIIVTGVGPVAKDLTDVAVWPFFTLIAVVGGVWGGVGHLHLCGAVLGVVEVEAVADVAEQSRGRLLLRGLLVMAVIVIQLTGIISVESSSCHFLQFVLEFLVLPLEVNDD